jgi:hypothetical protein
MKAQPSGISRRLPTPILFMRTKSAALHRGLADVVLAANKFAGRRRELVDLL